MLFSLFSLTMLFYIQIWKIKREGEYSRYKPFRDLHNKKLLWHGSRVTNFGGILSQGLRIAPPEAPVVSIQFQKAHSIFPVWQTLSEIKKKCFVSNFVFGCFVYNRDQLP